MLLHLTFRLIDEAPFIMARLSFALIGGFWFIYLLGHEVSIATIVGFIALAGVAAEFGVIMLIHQLARVDSHTNDDQLSGIRKGAVFRVHPKAMTVSVIIARLVPLFLGHGAGSEVMQRIAAPMIGGMITAPLLSMFVIPAAYRLMCAKRHGLVQV